MSRIVSVLHTLASVGGSSAKSIRSGSEGNSPGLHHWCRSIAATVQFVSERWLVTANQMRKRPSIRTVLAKRLSGPQQMPIRGERTMQSVDWQEVNVEKVRVHTVGALLGAMLDCLHLAVAAGKLPGFLERPKHCP